VKIEVEKGRVVAFLEDGQEAFITFGVEESEKVVVVSTTFVPESHRGKGIAGKLTAELVKWADSNGYRIYPLCSYTRKFLERKRPDLIVER